MRKTNGNIFQFLLTLLLLITATSSGHLVIPYIQDYEPPVYINLEVLPFPEPFTNDIPPSNDFISTVIPLKRAGRLLLMEAVIDGERGNLVFDTGATGLVLNRTYFRKYAVEEGGASKGITGSAGKLGCIYVKNMQVSELLYEDIKADVSDFGHIENRRGVKILGLFGFGLIRSFETVIDISHNELHLHKIDKHGDRISGPSQENQDYTQKIEPWHPVLIVDAKVGGKNLSFCFDTGAETNAISTGAPKNVLSTVSITRRSGLQGAGKGGNEVLYGVMNDFHLNDRLVKDMETIIVSLDALSEVYGVKIDGMLGYSFIEKGVFTINLVKKQFGVRFNNPEAL